MESTSRAPQTLLVHELMTSVEVGRMLRVSQPTLSRWREQGKGPRVLWLSPRVPRYAWTDVQAWLEANRS